MSYNDFASELISFYCSVQETLIREEDFSCISCHGRSSFLTADYGRFVHLPIYSVSRSFLDWNFSWHYVHCFARHSSVSCKAEEQQPSLSNGRHVRSNYTSRCVGTINFSRSPADHDSLHQCPHNLRHIYSDGVECGKSVPDCRRTERCQINSAAIYA